MREVTEGRGRNHLDIATNSTKKRAELGVGARFFVEFVAVSLGDGEGWWWCNAIYKFCILVMIKK